MTRPLIPLLALIAITGCGGNDPAPPKTTGAAQSAPRVEQQLAQATPTDPSKPGAVAQAPAPVPIPEGARFTIECARYGGPGHEQQARLVKDQVSRQTGRGDFRVVHNQNDSVLYLGYYRETERTRDPAEAKRSADDVNFLQQLKTASGSRYFRVPLAVAITTANPDAPPEWDLAKLDPEKPITDPDRLLWTVVIAGYTTDAVDEYGRAADRKKLAVDAVRDARKMFPNQQFYYYHGENISQVCVGAWPRKAIAEQEMSSAESSNEGKANSGEALVVSPTALPQAFTDKLEQNHNLRVVQPKVVILDPTLQQTLTTYSEYAVNGGLQMITVTDPVTGKKNTKAQPSFLTQIPVVQPSLLTGGSGSGVNDPGPTLINPMGPGTTGGLRGAPRQ